MSLGKKIAIMHYAIIIFRFHPKKLLEPCDYQHNTSRPEFCEIFAIFASINDDEVSSSGGRTLGNVASVGRGNENGSKSASFVRNQHHGGTHTDVTKLETWKFACNNVLHVSFKALPIHQHVS